MRTTTKLIVANSLITLLVVLTFALFTLNRIYSAALTEEHKDLEKCIRTFWELIGHKGTEYKLVGGQLLVGDYVINGNFELPDKVQEIFGGVATVFMGDERVSTNVLNDEGKRAVGTRLVGPAYNAIFKQGQPYRGKTLILGQPYLTAYDPIRGKNGDIIGVLFVGIKKSSFLEEFNQIRSPIIIMLVILLTSLAILTLLLLKMTRKFESTEANNLNFLKTLLDTIPSPIFYKNSTGRYLGCNKAFESYVGLSQDELVGKTAHELWLKELADRYQQQDLALLNNPGMQFYESSVTHADGILHDVIFNKATFLGSDGSVGGLVGVILDITERKQAEKELAFRNILLSVQQESSIDGILVVDENANILSYNRRFREIMGIPPQLLEAKDDSPVLEYVTGQVANPDLFLERVKYLYARQHETSQDEIELQNGSILDRYSAPLHGSDGQYYGRLWTFRDITERKQTEEKIKNAYQQMLDIIEFLPDATFVLDEQKRVIAWNKAMEGLTGVVKSEILGKGNHEYALPFYGERRPLLIDYLDKDDDELRDHYDYIQKDGRTIFAQVALPPLHNREARFVSITASPLFDRYGNQVGSIQSVRDVTEIRCVNSEKSRLEVQLQHSRMMQSVMVQLGHDLKTPLTPLTTLLPIFSKHVNDRQLKRLVEICSENALQISELIDKTLNLASLSTMLTSAEHKNIVLTYALDALLASSFGDASCENAIAPDIVVQAVPDQLNKLFANLISNAISYSPTAGIVRITAEQTETAVTVAVRDDGIGLVPEHLERIFDEFFKVDESRHDLARSGLGLSICRRIVLNHQGKIWAESPGTGKGTTIFFTLPRNIS